MRNIKKTLATALALACIGSNALAVEATVIGKGIADGSGRGTINASVDASLDGPTVADKVTEQVQLTNGARPKIVTVENGNLGIEFEAAAPSSEVEALLPVDLANSLAGSAVVAATVSQPIIGGAAVLVTGGVLGGLAATGKFDGSTVFSPIR